MNLLKARSVAQFTLIFFAGTALLAQPSVSPIQTGARGPVPLHLPPANAISEQAAALLTPQATTAVTSAVNAASFQATHSPGSLTILTGSDLILPQPTTIVTSVKANGIDAPVVQSSPTRLTLQIPTELPSGPVNLAVQRWGQTLATKAIDVSPYSPGIFTVSGDGQGRASAEDALGLAFTDAHLAIPGTAVTIYAVGLGQTVPPVVTGQIPATPLPTAITPAVVLGGQQATGVLAQLTNTSLGVYKVTFTVPVTTGPGEQPLFLQIGASSSNIASIPVQGALGPMPPTADSVTPASGTASNQTFSAVYSDPNGTQDLAWTQLLLAVAPNGGGQPFCFVHYDRAGNGLWLYGDGGFFVGPVAPGTVSADLKNSACAVNTSATTFTMLGTALTLNVPVAFKTGFAGSKNIYLRAYDRSDQDTGWLQRGTVTVSNPTPPTLSILPSSGAGSAQIFTATYPDAPGFTGINLGWAQMLFAVATDGGGQPFCLVHYDRAGNGLWLYGDSGFFLGPVTPGVPSNSLQNSSCAIDTAASTAANVNGALELRLSTFFGQAIAGYRKVYLRTLSPIGLDTGFLQAGTWTSYNLPALLEITPDSGSGGPQVFTGRFFDPYLATPILGEEILLAVAPDLGGQPGCVVHYDRPGKMLWLSNDNLHFVGPVPIGSAAILHLGQCSLDAAASSAAELASPLGNYYTLSAAVSFHAGIPPALKTYLRARESDGFTAPDTGFQQRGVWTPIVTSAAQAPTRQK